MSDDGISVLRGLSESRMFPSVRDLGRVGSHEIARLVHQHLVAIRILATDDQFDAGVSAYCRRTAMAGDFERWRHDATDLYVLLHALTDKGVSLHDGEQGILFRKHLHLDTPLLIRWLRSEARDHPTEVLTRRLFARMDLMLRVEDTALRSVRRQAVDWSVLDDDEQKETMTRLLGFFRHHAPRSEIRRQLEAMAASRALDLDHEAEQEVDEKKPRGLLATLVDECASAGATSAGNVATVVGGLGAGFDNDHSKSIYGKPKEPNASKSTVIRRGKAPG